MIDAIGWFVSNLGLAFYNFGYALTHPGLWLDWVIPFQDLATPQDKQSLMRLVYYGGSVEFFFVFFTAFLTLTGLGIWRKSIMWRSVRILEGFGNTIGRFAAWAGLLMVIQQIVIVFLQRIFRVSEISFGPTAPFGYEFYDWVSVTFDLSWWSEELKLYNAIVVTLACAYTFVQGGHVRVDLFYAGARYGTKKIVDMFGALFFMIPALVLMWLYSWYFLWRHLITPKVSASDKLDLLLRKATILRWNVETIGFSPNGFNAYWLFKLLLLLFVAMMFVQAIAFFYRSLLEWREGPEAEGRYLDKDRLDGGDEALSGTH